MYCEYCLYDETLIQGYPTMDTSIVFLGISLSSWGVIASFFMVLATLFMAYATWKMAKTTQKTFDQQNKPYVIIYVQQRIDAPQVLQIIIENVGSSPAYDVRFDIPDNLFYRCRGLEECNLKEPKKFDSGPLIHGIATFHAKQKFIIDWGQHGGIKKSLNGREAEIKVNFNNSFGIKQPQLKCVLDIKEFETSAANESIELRNMKSIAKLPDKLESIRSLLDKKLTPQSPEATYMWAYIAYKLMEGNYPLEYIIQYEAGLTSEQREHAEHEARVLIETYRPDIFSDEKR